MTALQAFASPITAPDVDTTIPVFSSVEEVLATLADDVPIQVLYPHIIEDTARRFLEHFPGTIMYAVKCNPTPAVLKMLIRAGICNFDVASIDEIDLVRAIAPGAKLYFMHPVKSRKAIRHAYMAGVRDFSLDSHAELAKILEETGGATDLKLHIRLDLPKGDAALDLSGKFGVAGVEAVSLMQATRVHAKQLGVCFHVGSQCMNPDRFAQAVALVRELVDMSGTAIDMLDVGGGFPIHYPDMSPPPFGDFMTVIRKAVKDNGFDGLTLLGEPGRALVGEGGSILVKVELRKGAKLYLNDGTFGSLFDAGAIGWKYPVRALRSGQWTGQADPVDYADFSFFGPTCDSMDLMEGPFRLPEDMSEGDWIEIGHLGAYGAAMRTRFNGFYSDITVAVAPRADTAPNIVPLQRAAGAALMTCKET